MKTQNFWTCNFAYDSRQYVSYDYDISCPASQKPASHDIDHPLVYLMAAIGVLICLIIAIAMGDWKPFRGNSCWWGAPLIHVKAFFVTGGNQTYKWSVFYSSYRLIYWTVGFVEIFWELVLTRSLIYLFVWNFLVLIHFKLLFCSWFQW